ncbi:pantoate--beta-alanine ligase [Mesonia sp. K7]|uniref:pantoate--beta-alanine ligase n=1 Tax=Mesonia sp. K7 TaxID=2218606 RepID=UPI000DAA4558|nr:pantoate--beta-alanine ligase [Mesonia sp. K7]PZD78979.1 pantoate--beta-alanine ligase [Mesonia sp. K7]
MEVFHQQKALKSYLNDKRENNTIGFVPTMGALHNGHLSLVEEAYKQCDLVVVSIFVNPTQFDNPEDLEKYPKTLQKDKELLEESFREIIIYAPAVVDVYPEKVVSQQFDFGELETKMEGKYRSGHFDGVGTIVKKLFEIVEPHKAFFGKKDYQQYLIIKKLVEVTKLPVEIIGCPIKREENGLARSSRNERLSSTERKEATFIYQTLQQVKSEFGIKSAKEIIENVKKAFEKHQIFELEYFEIANAENLNPLVSKPKKNTKYRAFIAAYLGKIRLIDNIALN